jgi:hypothetical protein
MLKAFKLYEKEIKQEENELPTTGNIPPQEEITKTTQTN